MALEFRVLGEVAIVRDGGRLDLGGRRPRAVVAALLVQRGRPVLLESLIDRLWPEEPPDTAAKTIQVYVSRLRAQLGDDRDRLRSTKGGYELAIHDGELDAEVFEALAVAARRHLDAGAVGDALAAADRATAEWRGRPFGDLADEPFLRPATSRLENLATDLEELRARALVAAGRSAEAAGVLRQLVADQPARESAWSQLLLALYAAGRQADALAAYHEVRTYLDDELGIEPGPELEAAHLAVLQQSAPLAPAAPFAALRTPRDAGPTGDQLIGRDAEIAAIEAAIEGGAKLVTLVGPGGIGKTTLARAVVQRRRAAGDGSSPAILVELEALRDPDLVPAAVAAALGGEGDAASQIGPASALIGLDNVEQVIGAATWVAGFLRDCPGLRIVATSREPLRIADERVHPVAALDAPSARTLFLARAHRVRPELEPVPEIDAACRRLDGLPLAIELAAARMNLLSPAALVARLDHALDVLATGPRDRPDRQRTLRATISWSYDLLDEPLRRVFRRLAVFSGGFDAGAAETVAEATLDDLDALLAQSLTTSRYDRAEPRFALLETIREFAAERLETEDDAPVARTRHADWALALVERAALAPRGDVATLQSLAGELDNFRAAMAWAGSQGDDSTRLRIAVGLAEVWQSRGHLAEAARWLEPGLETAVIPETLRSEVLEDASTVAFRQGRLDDAERMAEEVLALAERLDQPRRRVGAISKLAQIALQRGDTDGARVLHERAVGLAVHSADRRPLLVSLTGQANADLLAGRIELAVAAFAQAATLAVEVGRPESVATAYFNLGLARVIEGRDPRAAATALRQALDRYLGLEDTEGVGYVLVAIGGLACATDARQAAMAIGASDAALAAIGAELEAVETRLRSETLERLAASLGRRARDDAMRAGADLDEDGRLELARRLLDGV